LAGGKPATTNANNQDFEGMSHRIELNRDPAMAALREERNGDAATRTGAGSVWGWLWLGCVLAGVNGNVSAAEWASSKNRFNLNTHIGFNIEANFERLGGVSGSNVGSELRGTDHFYDDGFNRVDATGNAGGATQFWGYDSASQVVGESLVMSSYSATGTGRIEAVTDAPHWGAELTYARELGWNSSYWWGVEIGWSWTDLSIREQSTMQGDATVLRDAYALNGMVPPAAPYAGTFGGAGPRLSDAPERTLQTLSGAAQTTGKYELDGSMYVMRVGLIYETPFSSWLSLQFGGGVAGGYVDSTFSFEETTNLAGSRQSVVRGSDQSDDFVGGAYAHGGLAFHFHEDFMASVGLQYNYLGTFSQEAAGRKAELDFSSALYLSIGLGVKF
jgi:hypothetical protein